MNEATPFRFPTQSRRRALLSTGCGLGYLAFADLAARAASATIPKATHFPARAKHVIFLFMQGGPSQVDSFDYKPALEKWHGKEGSAGRHYWKSLWGFRQYGRSGMWISDLFPDIARHADDLCVINSMHTDIGNHPEAILQMNTGSFRFVRPSVGAWVNYGLGTENQNLPGFITINPDFSAGGAQKHGAAFLPSACAGTAIGNGGTGDGKGAKPIKDVRIPFADNPQWSSAEQRRQLDLLQTLNRDRLARDGVNEPLEGLIESYELAFRMQTELPDRMDVNREPEHIRRLYGVDREPTDNFGRACLMARRFVESGVRFVQLNHGFWDHHVGIEKGMADHAAQTVQPIGALMTDLKQRGLWDDTLILWGGEFGRPPLLNKNKGRDHNNVGFTMWMAGGAVKGGLRYGSTDETGYKAEEKPVHLHDLHATLLHILGLDHERLTYRYGGRDFRLTDVHGNVVREILA